MHLFGFIIRNPWEDICT